MFMKLFLIKKYIYLAFLVKFCFGFLRIHAWAMSFVALPAWSRCRQDQDTHTRLENYPGENGTSSVLLLFLRAEMLIHTHWWLFASSTCACRDFGLVEMAHSLAATRVGRDKDVHDFFIRPKSVREIWQCACTLRLELIVESELACSLVKMKLGVVLLQAKI